MVDPWLQLAGIVFLVLLIFVVYVPLAIFVLDKNVVYLISFIGVILLAWMHWKDLYGAARGFLMSGNNNNSNRSLNSSKSMARAAPKRRNVKLANN